MRILHIKHIVSLLLAIAVGSASWAQTDERELRFGELKINDLETGYCSVELEGCNSSNQNVGMPEIPLLQWIVEIEDEAEIEIEEKDSMWVDLGSEHWIVPAQPSQLKNRETDTWEIDYGTYQQDVLYGLPLTELTPLGTMGKKRLARVTIAPLKYNPQRNQLLIYHRLKYRIKGIDQRKVANREDSYTAVVPWKYAEAIAPLLQWRKQLGWEVNTLYILDNNKDSIRGALREKYRNGEGSDYILLVGGLQDIQAFSGRRMVEGIESKWCDMYYGEYTNDWLPEAMVGRLSVDDTATLKRVVEKILQYEQHPDTNALKKSLLVAGQEGRAPAPTTTNGQVNYGSRQLGLVVDTNCFRNPESNGLRDSIVEKLNEGMGLINYTSHCERDRWEHPTITMAEMDSIAGYAGIWINNCCLSNQIGNNSLGENLLRQSQGGGVGIIGSTNETFWEEDYYWSVGAKRPIVINPTYDSLHLGAIDHLLKRETLGEILMAGNMAVSAVGSPYEAYYWEIYNLFGDPAMRPYLGITTMVDSTQISSLNIGLSEVACRGMAGACVSLWQGNEIIGKCKLNAQGEGSITLKQQLSEDSVIVTSSKTGYIPNVDTLVPSRPEGGWIMTKIIAEPDSIAMGENVMVKIAYKNVGDDVARNHQIKLDQTSEDSIGAWMTQTFEWDINELAPNETDTVMVEIALEKLNEVSELKMHLTTKKEETTYASQPIVWQVKRSKLNEELRIVEGGELIKQLLPHKQYTIEWKLTNNTPYSIERVESKISVESYPSRLIREVEHNFSMATMTDSVLKLEITTDDTLQGLWITTEALYDGVTINHNGWWIAGKASEDFEKGDLINYAWENHSYMPWRIDENELHSGNYSLKSGDLDDHQRCDIDLWIDVAAKDSIGFWYKVSSESHADKLYFYLNNVERFFDSGDKDWTYWEMEIPKGQHKLTWRYQKNESGLIGEDAAWIDDIRLPISEWNIICGSMDTMIYKETNGIEIIPQTSEWEIWPNPASEKINIRCNEHGEITILDCIGRKIDTIKIENSDTTQYSTVKLRFGLYLLVYTNTKGTSTKKLMITR